MPSKSCSADVTALILAGGKATRLGGVDKRELVVDGRTIFERQREILAGLPLLVSSRGEIAGVTVVRDAIVDGGPLAGIAAGLAAVRTTWLLVLAGDMPFVTRAVVERLLAAATEDIDAVGVRVDGRPEPLVCVLRVSVYLPIVQDRLARGALKASRLLEDAPRITWLDEADPRPFWNVNAPEDL